MAVGSGFAIKVLQIKATAVNCFDPKFRTLYHILNILTLLDLMSLTLWVSYFIFKITFY